MATLSLESVQELLDQSRGPGLMLSYYADVSVAEGFKSHWRGHFKTATQEFRETLANDHQARLEFDRNVEAARRILEATLEPEGRGLAVFSSEQRKFLRSFPLRVPVENQLVIHELPYVVPLLEVLVEDCEYLVVLADTHRGQLWSTTCTAAIRPLATLDEAVPPRERSTHRDDHLLHFQKELVQVIEKAWAAQTFAGILLLGEKEAIEHLRKRLPPRLSAQVVHEAACNWLDIRLDLSAELRTLIAEVRRQQGVRIQRDLHERLEERRAIAVGRKEVLDALQTGKVGPQGHGRLILGKDPKEAVARCIACRFLSLEAPATCPRCQAVCVQGSLWEELLFFALRHHLLITFLKADETLRRMGGAAALLSG
jgi:hypothetical protein